MVGNDQ